MRLFRARLRIALSKPVCFAMLDSMQILARRSKPIAYCKKADETGPTSEEEGAAPVHLKSCPPPKQYEFGVF